MGFPPFHAIIVHRTGLMAEKGGLTYRFACFVMSKSRRALFGKGTGNEV